MRFLKVCAFVLALSVSGIASAGQPVSGFYVGGFGGVNFHKADIGGRSILYKKASYDETAFHAGLQAGVRIINVRATVEATYNTKVDFTDYQLEGKNYALQLYYDLPFRSILRPYLNIGFGKYTMTMRMKPGISDEFKKTAFNYGGGLSLAITRRTNLDIGYRFVDLGKKNLLDSEGNPDIPVDLLQHQIYMGFRYVF